MENDEIVDELEVAVEVEIDNETDVIVVEGKLEWEVIVDVLEEEFVLDAFVVFVRSFPLKLAEYAAKVAPTIINTAAKAMTSLEIPR